MKNVLFDVFCRFRRRNIAFLRSNKTKKQVKKVLSALLKYGVPVAIGVGLAYFLFTNVDLEAIKTSLKQDVDYRWFIPVIIVSIFSHVFRALRWRLQLRAINVNPPLSMIVNSIFGTYFVNLIFPRLGEVWRTGYIANRQKASFTQVLGSMVGDRLADTLTVGLLTIVTFFLAQDAFMQFLGARDGNASGGGLLSSWLFWLTLACCVLGVIALVWLVRAPRRNGFIGKLQLMVSNLWEGLAAVAKMDGKWLFLLYTVLIWGCYFLQLYIASFAFTFTANLGVIAILVLFVLSSLGMAVPSNGGLGAWQYAIIFGLSIYGIGTVAPGVPYDPQASAFAWLVWGIQQLLLIVLGIYAFASMAIDKRRIAQGKTIVDTTNDQVKL